jgi:hypothetical protein
LAADAVAATVAGQPFVTAGAETAALGSTDAMTGMLGYPGTCDAPAAAPPCTRAQGAQRRAVGGLLQQLRQMLACLPLQLLLKSCTAAAAAAAAGPHGFRQL